ncbi:Gfo/Idh/MocA family protein [Candidatus Ponderosibacter sp. Uisw_141_02]|uniref:Gfo/Idh/MocA family protein n=1 Tax=Candidatus Ponderosibacter sp. Uisw_141_02 TaxID=3231000 RepID=UPI003D3CCA4C
MKRRVGVIGGGMMTQVGHLPFLFKNHNIEVVSVAETRPSVKNYLKTLYKGLNFVDDYRALFNEGLDFILLSAPRDCVFPLSIEVIENGISLVTEKPAVHNLNQAYQLQAALQTHQVDYFVCYMKRYDTGIQQLKEKIKEFRKSGEAGKLVSVHFENHNDGYAFQPPPHVRPTESRQCRFPISECAPTFLPSNLLETYKWFNNAISHDINLINFLLGKFTDIEFHTYVNNFRVEGHGIADGLHITFDVSKRKLKSWHEKVWVRFEKESLTAELPSPMNTNGVSKIFSNKGPLRTRGPKKWCFENQAHGYMNSIDSPLSSINEVIEDYELIEKIWLNTSKGP